MIITITPNPGLDLTYTLPDAAEQEEDVQRATSSTLEASGKGVNVSRALAKAGVPTCAVLPAGGATGRYLAELLDDEGVEHRTSEQVGDTRVNTTALRPAGVTVKVNGPGGALTGVEQEALLENLRLALGAATRDAPGPLWVALCGSLPPGAGPALVRDVVRLAHEHGARCAVDASGEALAAAVDAGADLLAPNRAELAQVSPAAATASTIEELAQAAAGLARQTGSQLLVSLGPEGALYTDGTTVLRGWAPPLTPVNTAGAGDALLSGWLAAEDDPEHRIARAVRWGRSACLAATTVDPAPGQGDQAPVTVRNLDPGAVA